jgi:hypothetical protein
VLFISTSIEEEEVEKITQANKETFEELFSS